MKMMVLHICRRNLIVDMNCLVDTMYLGEKGIQQLTIVICDGDGH